MEKIAMMVGVIAAAIGALAKCKRQLDNLVEYKKDLIYECVTGKREVEVGG